MKKTILLYVSLLCLFLVQAQTTPIPDPNFEAALMGLGIDTNGFTGDILNTDAQAVIDLNVSNSNIGDLSGIEAFINLDRLTISDNHIQNLDLSSNTQLRQLFFRNNILDALDVSMLSNLEFIDCSINNLIHLDVSHNLLLRDLDCQANTITSLDLSNNTQLLSLRAATNQLTDLNIANGNNSHIANQNFSIEINHNLTCVQVSDVAYANANWLHKDATASYHLSCATTPIPDANFENKLIALGVDTNGVTGDILNEDAEAIISLDVNSSLINDLTGIEAFTNLTSLNFDSNSIMDVDLSSNINLASLTASNNQLQSLVLNNNPNLTFIDCYNNQIQSLDTSLLPNLIEFYCNNNQLQSLDLSQNTALNLVLANDNLLTDLNLANGNNAAIPTANLVIANNNLTCVQVSDVAYANANWTIKDAGTTYHLSCATTAIPDGAFENKLIALGIDTNGFTGDILNEDAETVVILDVSNIGAQNLFGIEAFVNLESLDASHNSLGTDGDEDFSQNIKLTRLDLQRNILDNLDVSTLVDLEILEVSFNSINSLDVSNNTNLRLLYCAGNQMGTVTLGNKPNLTEFLGRLNNFHQIDFSQAPLMQAIGIDSNQLTNLDVSNNPNLQRLDCTNNVLTTLDVRNGNNSAISNIWFSAINNNLTCIDVSDVAYANANWSNGVDPGVGFSLDCFPTTPVPDAAFETKLIQLGIDTNGFTGDILNADAEAVNTLDVSNSFINDLAGIEAFTNLTSLNCSDNNIDTLNTSASSQLTNLNCSHNALTSLTVLANFNLQILDCSFNSLNNLLLTFNDNLVELYCSANNIGFLNVAAKNNLQKLECGANNLNSLDVLANVNLTRLSAYSNHIGAINVSNNIALTYLSVSNNPLNSLDVTANINLTTLSCFNNGLTELNVSANTQLSRLNCSNNQLTNLDVRNGNNLNIPTANFDATNNNLTCIKVDEIAFATANWTNIDAGVTFELYCEPFTLIPDVDFENKLIALGIDTNGFTGDILNSDAAPVINLDISSFGIEDITGIEAFISLENLNAASNSIGVNGLVDFSQNVALRILDLRNNAVDTIDVSQNVALTYLNLNSNNLTNIDISNNVNLQTLGVFSNGFNNSDLDITANTALTNLNATSNHLVDIDLSNNTLLKVLRLKSNNLNALDITNNSALTFLDVKSNQIPAIDFSNNSSLLTAKISYNPFPIIDLTPLVNLKTLELRKTEIHQVDLSQNVALENLKIGQNYIRDLDLNANVNLVNLSVDGGNAVSSQLKKIKSIALDQCVNLENLNLNSNLLKIVKLPVPNALTTIDVSVNNLVKLDLQSAANIEILQASNNNLDCLDVSNLLFLKEIDIQNNNLHYVQAKSSNLYNWTIFNTLGNPNLSCINVDDEPYATANFGATIDPTSSFNQDCYPVTNWDGMAWDNGLPDNTKTAVVKGDYDTSIDGNFTAFELIVHPGITLSIPDGTYVKAEHSLTNLGIINIANQGSFNQKYECAINKGNGSFNVDKITNPLIDEDRFTYWSAPIENQVIGDVLMYANLAKIYDFDKDIQEWHNIPGVSIMQTTIGYVAKPKDNSAFPLQAHVTFKGAVPNNGIYQTDVVYNPGGIDDDNNLVGNPYPSAINANALFAENPNLNTLYFWTPNSPIVNGAYAGDDYATYSLAGGTAAATGGPVKSKFIASCQGFFASTNAAGKLTFKNNMRVNNRNNDFRRPTNPTDDKLWVNMFNDDGLFNQVLIAFLPNTTANFDNGYDGLKFNAGNPLTFYSLGSNQEHLAINAKEVLDQEQTIPLGFNVEDATIQTLKISIAQLENLNNVNIYLKDNALHVVHDLRRGDYIFQVTQTGTIDTRFELFVSRNALATSENTVTDTIIISNTNETEIKVQSLAKNIRKITAYDILGKEIINVKANQNTINITTNIKQGTVMFFKIALENGKTIQKKFIKL